MSETLTPDAPDRRPALSKVSHARAELARQIRRTLRGEVKPVDLSRYARALEILADLCERESHEERLEALEKFAEETGGKQWRDLINRSDSKSSKPN